MADGKNCDDFELKVRDISGLHCHECKYYDEFIGKEGQDLAKCKATGGWLTIDNLEPCDKWEENTGDSKDEPQYETIPDEQKKDAMELLTKGDTRKFILDTFHRTHVGDSSIGNVCLASIVTTMIKNTKGLHVKPSGGSGKGKSDAIKAILHLIPAEKKQIGSLSGKSIFYNDDIRKGTIIFSDDIKLNEDVTTTIKQTTSFYQQVYAHHTVSKDLKGVVLTVPERLCWILTSVNGFDDDQMGNRFVGLDVNETDQQDELVFQKQVEMELLGITENTVDDDVLVCRAIFQILDEEEHYVHIPYIESIEWHNKDNRRNFPMFMDIVKSVTVFNKFQREKYKGAYLSSIDDFYTAREIYESMAESNATNLTEREIKLLRWLSKIEIGAQDLTQIQEFLETPKTTTKNLLHGRKNDGGLLLKIPGLKHEKETVSTENGKTLKNYYWYEGEGGLRSFGNVVSLVENTMDQSIDNFKQVFGGVNNAD